MASVNSSMEINRQPLVSVVTAFFNAQSFIAEAVESVIAQTYHDWELLLFDDGSGDESSSTARRYSEQYPAKIHYLEHFNHQNRGVCVSRNVAVQQSRG